LESPRYTKTRLYFESLCIRNLRVYTSADDGEFFHYRDKSDLEANTTVRLKEGRVMQYCRVAGGSSAGKPS
jgi:hypothetical protein